MHLGSKRRRLCVAEQLLEVCVHWYPHHLRATTHTHTHTHTFPGDHVRMRHINELATYECTHRQTDTHTHMPSIHPTRTSHAHPTRTSHAHHTHIPRTSHAHHAHITRTSWAMWLKTKRVKCQEHTKICIHFCTHNSVNHCFDPFLRAYPAHDFWLFQKKKWHFSPPKRHTSSSCLFVHILRITLFGSKKGDILFLIQPISLSQMRWHAEKMFSVHIQRMTLLGPKKKNSSYTLFLVQANALVVARTWGDVLMKKHRK